MSYNNRPPINDQDLPPLYRRSQSQQQFNAPPLYSEASQQRQPQQQQQPIESQLPDTSQLSRAKLEQLLEDEDAFIAYLLELPVVKNRKKALEDMKSSNVELAKKNIASADSIEKLKKELSELHHELAMKQQTMDSLLHQRNQLMSVFSFDSIKNKLKDAVAALEGETESIASEFLSGKMSQDDFVRVYKEARKHYHLRNATADGFQNIYR